MKTIVIDANGLAWNIFYGVKGLSHNNKDTNVIYGFLNELLYLGHRFKSNDFVFCWDSKNNYRLRLYPEYKQKRKEDPKKQEAKAKAFPQFDALRKIILPEMGFKNNYLQGGVESDDLIAKICTDYIQPILLVSGDEDMYQCLYPHVTIYQPSKNRVYTTDDFTEEFNIPFWKWIWVKGYAGCKSDEVKGIEGIGEVKAIQYINQQLKGKSKAYQSIVSKEGKRIYKRNLKLVSLPHPKTKSIELQNNRFSKKGFIKVCDEYGLESFKTKDWKQWVALFLGKFQHKGANHGKRGRIRKKNM